jgi:predicted nucleic acid-binding protein
LIVTLDASVWISAISTAEREHARCAALIADLVDRRVPLYQPVLFVIEVSATIGRRTRDPALAMATADATLATPNLSLVPLDHALAADAASLAASCALRGADAVYVATARHGRATLLTLDAEVRERAAGVITVHTPDEWSRALRDAQPAAR